MVSVQSSNSEKNKGTKELGIEGFCNSSRENNEKVKAHPK
jgi:hypothetical protein